MVRAGADTFWGGGATEFVAGMCCAYCGHSCTVCCGLAICALQSGLRQCLCVAEARGEASLVRQPAEDLFCAPERQGSGLTAANVLMAARKSRSLT